MLYWASLIFCSFFHPLCFVFCHLFYPSVSAYFFKASTVSLDRFWLLFHSFIQFLKTWMRLESSGWSSICHSILTPYSVFWASVHILLILKSGRIFSEFKNQHLLFLASSYSFSPFMILSCPLGSSFVWPFLCQHLVYFFTISFSVSLAIPRALSFNSLSLTPYLSSELSK